MVKMFVRVAFDVGSVSSPTLKQRLRQAASRANKRYQLSPIFIWTYTRTCAPHGKFFALSVWPMTLGIVCRPVVSRQSSSDHVGTTRGAVLEQSLPHGKLEFSLNVKAAERPASPDAPHAYQSMTSSVSAVGCLPLLCKVNAQTAASNARSLR